MMLRAVTAAAIAILATWEPSKGSHTLPRWNPSSEARRVPTRLAAGPQAEPPRRAPGTTPLPDTLGAEPPPFRYVEQQRGVALGMFAEDISFSYGPLLAEIVALGATHVALIVPLYQTDASSHDIGLDTRRSPTISVIAEVVRAARRDRLEVMLVPIVRLSAPRAGEWRGTLAPADRAAWFRRYGDVVGELAAVGALTGASRLAIGSELSSLDGALAEWRPLVERIRAIFPGKLVYSANWDHYRAAPLYDLVDEEGISAYFNLRDQAAPADDAALEAGWRRVRREIDAWRAGRTRPFVFTELGYRSRAGATAAPWDETAGGTPDLEEQRRAFAAFRRVWAAAPTLTGFYVWNWYGYGGPGTTSYTPRGKPAESEVRALLGAI
jgi:hypothetical protein